jgi:hypothetical protein
LKGRGGGGTGNGFKEGEGGRV